MNVFIYEYIHIVCSTLCTVKATWTQGLSDWIGSHARCFGFLGGTPEVVVPDNLRRSITKVCFYEPDINPTYQEMAAHYGVAVIPARVARPRDKAKAEVGVQVVERWILARLRNRVFFSLTELNQAIRGLMERLNTRPFHKLPGSRKSLFDTLDRSALRPLPEDRYEYAEWKKVRANIDYHVEFEGHYYSVPYQLLKNPMELQATAETVECFHKGKRAASHGRSYVKGGHTTLPEHMPSSHWIGILVWMWNAETLAIVLLSTPARLPSLGRVSAAQR